MTDKSNVIQLPRRMPEQKPGRSKQDYRTPRAFLDAVEKKFGKLAFDLAANRSNDITRRGLYYGPGSKHGEDSLAKDWRKLSGNLWLNPEFARIAPWAEKCEESFTLASSRQPYRRLFFLVPASVGANWYAQHVHDKARVIFLNGRLSFDGKDPYPKDCMLAVFGLPPGFEVWRWK